jgi:hypothetical protein
MRTYWKMLYDQRLAAGGHAVRRARCEAGTLSLCISAQKGMETRSSGRIITWLYAAFAGAARVDLSPMDCLRT